MTAKSNEQITSGNVLPWVKRVEAQRDQAAVMSAIIETKEFDKIKVSRPMQTSSPITPTQHNTPSQSACRYCGGTHPPRQCPAYGKMCMEWSKVGHFCRVCRGKKTRAVNRLGQEIMQENTGEDYEIVSINSEYFNKNCSIVTANLKTLVGKNSMSVPYKIDAESNGNIIPLHIFKKLFSWVTIEWLTQTVNKHMLLKTYNKTTITQLGTCRVIIEHKNKQKEMSILCSSW